mgnify:CR=1 FL=1
MSMQSFYDTLNRSRLSGLFAIARASLRKVLAVRSQTDWTSWDESSVSA